MGIEINRGKLILKNWEERQRELNALGEGNISTEIKREKYIYLRSGLVRLAINPTIDDHIYAGVIKAIMQKIRKDFFPNLLLRKYMEWKEQLLIMPGLTKYFQNKREDNVDLLNKRMDDMGITGLTDHLRFKLDYERENIDLPITSRFEQNGALEVTLQFEKENNEYKLRSMKATLLTTGEVDRHCLIPETYKLNVNHAVCLLKGGAVRLEQVAGQKAEKWLQLDFDHKDEKNYFPLREHVLEEKFSLDKIIDEISRELGYPILNQQEVLEIVKNGGQAVFKPENMDAFYLQANPRDKGFLFRDEYQKILPLNELKETLATKPTRMQDKHLTVKKLDVAKKLDKHQALGI